MLQRKALILGASGFVGGFCLESLLEDPLYNQVIALSRSPLQREHPKLVNHIVDFDQRDQVAPLCEADDVYCTIGSTRKSAGGRKGFRAVDYGLVTWLCRAASERGAKQLALVSSSGVEEASILFYCRVKGEVERAVTEMNYQKVAILRPSLFRGKRRNPRISETIGKAIMVPLFFVYVGPLKKYKPIFAEAVGRAMPLALKEDFSGLRVLESHQITNLMDAAQTEPEAQAETHTEAKQVVSG